MNADRLLEHFGRIADAPEAIARLRRFILDLAVRGKLVTQQPGDEPAPTLLKRIAFERAQARGHKGLKEDDAGSVASKLVSLAELPSGWQITNLRSICISITDGDHLPPPKAESGVPFLVIGNVRSKSIDFTNCRFVAKDYYESLDYTRRPKKGDLLYTLVGSYGIPVMVLDDRAFCIQRHIGILRPSSQVELRFLAYIMESSLVFDQATNVATGIAQKTVSLAGLRGIEIPLPPLAEQHRIVAKVDELMALCDRLEAARAEREVTRDRLTAASLARLNTPDPDPATFATHARFALDHLPALTARPDQIKHLRQTILNLAVRGWLVEQDQADASASDLLKRIAAARATKAKAAQLRAKRPVSISDELAGVNLPQGWAIEALGNLVDPTASISYGVLVPGPDVDDGVPLVRAQDLSLTGHAPRPNKTISPSVEAPYARTRLRGGEILLCVVGSIGKIGIVPESWAGANIARAVARIAPVDGISSAYLLLAMQSDLIQRYFKEATRTLAQPTLNVGLIEVLPVPLPPLAEQQRIVAKVEALMALCDGLEVNLATAGASRGHLLEALLAEALKPTGEQTLKLAS